MADASASTADLWRVRKTVNEMLLDRGYVIPDADVDVSLAQFKERYGDPPERSRLTQVASRRDDQKDAIFVFWCNDKKAGVSSMKEFIEAMEEQHVNRCIIIFQQAITAQGKKVLAQCRYIVETFFERDLMVNITQHVLVPKHVVLADDDKVALLKKYKVKEIQLPRIKPVDPVAKYFGLQRGQVVKIIRPSETAGLYVTYRICL